MSAKLLNKVQEGILREASRMERCHITRDNENYAEAVDLYKKRLIKLAGANDRTCTMIGIYLTTAGRRYVEKMDQREKQ